MDGLAVVDHSIVFGSVAERVTDAFWSRIGVPTLPNQPERLGKGAPEIDPPREATVDRGRRKEIVCGAGCAGSRMVNELGDRSMNQSVIHLRPTAQCADLELQRSGLSLSLSLSMSPAASRPATLARSVVR